MLFRTLRSQVGASILQGIVLAGAVAVLGYVGTKSMTEQKMALKGLEAQGSSEQLHDVIYSILQNKDHCAATLTQAGTGITLNNPFTAGEHLVGDILLGGSTTPVFKSRPPEQGATFDSTFLYMNNSVAINRMLLTAAPDRLSGVFRIEMARLESQDASRRTGAGFGAKDVAKNINIKILLTDTGGFLSCYAVKEGNENEIEKFCQQLGSDNDPSTDDTLFTFDPATNTCKLKDLNCASGEVFAGFDSNGVKRCYKLQDWDNLSNYFDTTSAASCDETNANDVRFVTAPDNKVAIYCGTASASPPPSCTPTTSCTDIAAGFCTTDDAGNDSCGNDCGMGTNNCSCTPTTSCTDIAAGICSTSDAGNDSCGNDCGMGTKNCEDCRVYERYGDTATICFYQTGSPGPWYSVSAGCECQDIPGETDDYCDGSREGGFTETLCQNK